MKGTEDIRDKILDNLLLIGFIGAGMVFLYRGYIPQISEATQAVGAAFIIAGSVGIYMMLTTRQVAQNLYKRFDKQNTTLDKMDERLVGIAVSQKEMSASQKEMSASQKEMSASQKETAVTLKEMAATLRDIREILQK